MEPQTQPYHSRVARESILSTDDRKPKDRYWLHLLLFALTLASTIFTGGQFIGRFEAYSATPILFELGGLPVTTGLLLDGFRFAFSLLLFLTVHEFGHYFAARRHGIDTSLPYYIPTPLVGFGTLGAVIRIREPIPDTRRLFDVGAAGPLAGFVVAVAVLLYALITLPPPEYLFGVPGHEALKAYIGAHGSYPAAMLQENADPNTMVIVMGPTLLYWGLTQLFNGVPPMYEMYHYPVLLAGWLGLFFTALNLLPVGQLDGGHVLYALFGRKWHRILARVFFCVLLLSGSLGFMQMDGPWYGGWEPTEPVRWILLAAILFFFLYRVFGMNLKWLAPVLVTLVLLTAGILAVEPLAVELGYFGWFVFGLLIVLLVRIDHPPAGYERPLTRTQRMLGYACILIFVLCFSIRPLYIM